MSLEAGRKLAHYEILAKIGEGGMGEVLSLLFIRPGAPLLTFASGRPLARTKLLRIGLE